MQRKHAKGSKRIAKRTTKYKSKAEASEWGCEDSRVISVNTGGVVGDLRLSGNPLSGYKFMTRSHQIQITHLVHFI